MIVKLIRSTPWQTWLIPVGTALLTVGADRLRDQTEELRERFDDLTAAVELRRAQVLGAADLDTEPELPHEKADLEFSRRTPMRRPVVLVGLAVAGVVAGYLVRRAWSAALDQLDEMPEPFPWDRAAERAGAADPEPVDEHDQGDAEPVDEHAPDGGNHPAEGGASIGIMPAVDLDPAGLGIVEAAKIERMGTAAERLNRVKAQ